MKKVIVSPEITGMSDWIEGNNIDVIYNPLIRKYNLKVATSCGNFFDTQDKFKPL